MNYIENFDLFGIKAKEIPCIKGSGAPTISTPGEVGCFYMDTNSDFFLYKCVGASGGLYRWVSFASPLFVTLNLADMTADYESSDILWYLERGQIVFGRICVSDDYYIHIPLVYTDGTLSWFLRMGDDGIHYLYEVNDCYEVREMELNTSITGDMCQDLHMNHSSIYGASTIGVQSTDLNNQINGAITLSALPDEYDEEGHIVCGNAHFYQTDNDMYVRLRGIHDGVHDNDAATVGQLKTVTGDVSAALDHIIALQEELIGGDSE